jgi:hypothetical protein
LGTGVATTLWPHAKHDFSEPMVGLAALAATVLVFIAGKGTSRLSEESPGEQRPETNAGFSASGEKRMPGPLVGGRRKTGDQTQGRLQHLLLASAGLCAALATGAKYAALWLVPLLCIQIVLLTVPMWREKGVRAFLNTAGKRLATFVAPLAALGITAIAVSGRVPILWANLPNGLNRGWLDYPIWNGLYGLLASSGKGLFLYSPPLLLAVAGVILFARRHRHQAFIFLAIPALYLIVYGSKGVWHGGGWGPRYLVPVVPFLACLALPIVERALGPDGRWWRSIAAVLVFAGVAVQVVGVTKHPNLYTVMFRDHIAPALPDYGVALGGVPAEVYWRHFGGPGATRQLSRPHDGMDPSAPRRGLGYLYAAEGALAFQVSLHGDTPFDATLYVCDWDRRGRRQQIQVSHANQTHRYDQDYDLSGCEYLTRTVTSGEAVEFRVDEVTGHDVPVISAIFFDPAGESASPTFRRTPADARPWIGRFGRDGFVLFAWDRGQDVSRLPTYVRHISGGDRVWLDTGEAELTEIPLLYAPAFSPLLAHAWLLGVDLVTLALPSDAALHQRALASPPWRYLAGLEIHSPHPEYGLGLDLWPLLLQSNYRSHTGFMAVVWGLAGTLASGVMLFSWLLLRSLRSRPPQVVSVPVTFTGSLQQV